MIKLIWSLLTGITIIYIHLANPDMTETRLFLNFWWVWIIIIVAGIITVTVERKEP